MKGIKIKIIYFLKKLSIWIRYNNVMSVCHRTKIKGLQIIICCIPCNFVDLFLSGIYRYVFVSRNCLGRELCRCCYQLLLHCFVKYSAGILFAVKVWRLCKCIKLYFFCMLSKDWILHKGKIFPIWIWYTWLYNVQLYVWPGYHCYSNTHCDELYFH